MNTTELKATIRKEVNEFLESGSTMGINNVLDSITDRAVSMCREECVPEKRIIEHGDVTKPPHQFNRGYNDCHTHVLQAFDRIEGKDNK